MSLDYFVLIYARRCTGLLLIYNQGARDVIPNQGGIGGRFLGCMYQIAIAISWVQKRLWRGMLQSAKSANRSPDQDGRDRLWTTERTLTVCLRRPLCSMWCDVIIRIFIRCEGSNIGTTATSGTLVLYDSSSGSAGGGSSSCLLYTSPSPRD